MSVLLNILLFIIKFIAGKISGSISIIADAFNNLTDAGTVLLSSIGISISSIGPGKNHPEGHGKFEWVFALITSLSVVLVGWELLRDSIGSITNPESTTFSWITVIILAISISVKVYLYFYNINKSKKRNILSLKAVAIDSLSDAISTFAVLISLILNTLFDWQLDGYFGIAVSLLIMYNALKSAFESISSIVGTAASKEKLEQITKEVKAFFENDVPVIGLEILDNGYNRFKVSFHLVSTKEVSVELILETIPLIRKHLKTEYDYDSIIEVEKSIDQEQGYKIIENAQRKLIEAGFPFLFSDARVLECMNRTKQLVATISVPWLSRDKMDAINEFILKPESLGLNPEDSTLCSVVLCGHEKHISNDKVH